MLFGSLILLAASAAVAPSPLDSTLKCPRSAAASSSRAPSANSLEPRTVPPYDWAVDETPVPMTGIPHHVTGWRGRGRDFREIYLTKCKGQGMARQPRDTRRPLPVVQPQPRPQAAAHAAAPSGSSRRQASAPLLTIRENSTGDSDSSVDGERWPSWSVVASGFGLGRASTDPAPHGALAAKVPQSRSTGFDVARSSFDLALRDAPAARVPQSRSIDPDVFRSSFDPAPRDAPAAMCAGSSPLADDLRHSIVMWEGGRWVLAPKKNYNKIDYSTGL